MEPHDRGVADPRIVGSSYFSDRNFDLPLVAFLMNVALSSMWPSEWL